MLCIFILALGSARLCRHADLSPKGRQCFFHFVVLGFVIRWSVATRSGGGGGTTTQSRRAESAARSMMAGATMYKINRRIGGVFRFEK